MSDAGVLVVVEVRSVRDPESFRNYQAGAREQLAARGGSVVARGGSLIEGDAPFTALMVQKWPSEAAFRNWQESEEYAPLRAIRLKCADLRICVVSLI